jgi:hypothetical protein
MQQATIVLQSITKENVLNRISFQTKNRLKLKKWKK